MYETISDNVSSLAMCPFELRSSIQSDDWVFAFLLWSPLLSSWFILVWSVWIFVAITDLFDLSHQHPTRVLYI